MYARVGPKANPTASSYRRKDARAAVMTTRALASRAHLGVESRSRGFDSSLRDVDLMRVLIAAVARAPLRHGVACNHVDEIRKLCFQFRFGDKRLAATDAVFRFAHQARKVLEFGLDRGDSLMHLVLCGDDDLVLGLPARKANNVVVAFAFDQRLRGGGAFGFDFGLETVGLRCI